MLPVLSLSLNNPIKHGTIINKVHHPSKKISIFVNPVALHPNITPTIIKINPHNKLVNFFILSLPTYILLH